MVRDQLIVSLKGEAEREAPIPRAPHEPPQRRRRRRDWTGLIVFALLVAIGAGAYWYFMKDDGAPLKQPETPEEAEEQVLSIIERVGKHIVLPEGEEPTIATVSDPSKLAEQTFFANAKVGDVVLIYAQARKAYLYDPNIDKLLEVAPIAQ